MKSPSKDMYRASWCKTDNLNNKLRREQASFAHDVAIISRFPVQNWKRARAIAMNMNKKDGAFVKDAEKERYAWRLNPSYLNSFKGYGPNGEKLN